MDDPEDESLPHLQDTLSQQSVILETPTETIEAVPGRGTHENDFSLQDFHPGEPKPAAQFQYACYFENLRHSLNVLLKRPIKKPFAAQSKKIMILAN